MQYRHQNLQPAFKPALEVYLKTSDWKFSLILTSTIIQSLLNGLSHWIHCQVHNVSPEGYSQEAQWQARPFLQEVEFCEGQLWLSIPQVKPAWKFLSSALQPETLANPNFFIVLAFYVEVGKGVGTGTKRDCLGLRAFNAMCR